LTVCSKFGYFRCICIIVFSVRSKKDRKEQKSNFRDYVKTVEDGETYHEKMVINRREVLEIETWSQKKQYDTLCRVN
jgi:hypothetical protein